MEHFKRLVYISNHFYQTTISKERRSSNYSKLNIWLFILINIEFAANATIRGEFFLQGLM